MAAFKLTSIADLSSPVRRAFNSLKTYLDAQIVEAKSFATTLWDPVTWSTYTPTLTSLTLGDGTIQGWELYDAKNKLMHFNILLTHGTTTVIGTNPKFGFPTSHARGSTRLVAFAATAEDVSATAFYDLISASIEVANTTRTLYAGATISTSSPFTWAVGDLLAICGVYAT